MCLITNNFQHEIIDQQYIDRVCNLIIKYYGNLGKKIVQYIRNNIYDKKNNFYEYSLDLDVFLDFIDM